MTVPDEAVEAAARCQYEREWSTRWEDVRLSVRQGFLEDARAALTAAASFIAAQALNDAALDFELSPARSNAKLARHFNRVYVDRLRERAESFEGVGVCG